MLQLDCLRYKFFLSELGANKYSRQQVLSREESNIEGHKIEINII